MNTEEVIEKDLVVKIGFSGRLKAEAILNEVNGVENYPKKVTFKELFEYLLSNVPHNYLEELLKLRIQPEDKLKQLYEASGSTLSYPEWLLERMTVLDSMEKKSAKKKASGGVSV